jgi:hypothetical protein
MVEASISALAEHMVEEEGFLRDLFSSVMQEVTPVWVTILYLYEKGISAKHCMTGDTSFLL